jgi:D-tagatose-1,6-bisphosphate aldolase subunit GatZ/KbaZ
MSILLHTLLQNRRKAGNASGIYSVCSAHPWVLRASVQLAVIDESPLLIEATSNQVNQEGGYTGMLPVDFRRLVLDIAAKKGLPEERIILGGDHLGPNPWQSLPANEAMQRAEAMIAAYADAGFTKLHLDASMPCADDKGPLSDEVVAERAARLCAAAEKHRKGAHLVYIIGTEVPVPGGATESLSGLEVTSVEAARKTYEVHRSVFAAHGLSEAWSRVVGMVVQPGVEFNHDSVVDYVPSKAVELSAMLDQTRDLVFEAHSTDYQKNTSYRRLVIDGFAILKVGPALTFAMREALFALAAIEAELTDIAERSRLPEVMEHTMIAKPKYWANHYHGSAEQQSILRRYSYSDRLRYYWTEGPVQEAVTKLLANLARTRIPETLLSAMLPEEYLAVREGSITAEALPIVLHRIRRSLAPYAAACRPSEVILELD